MKRQAKKWGEHLQVTYLTKDLYPEHIENFKKN